MSQESERAETLGALRRAEYRVTPVKVEMRRNLLRKLAAGEEIFPGFRGYSDTVIPQIENAVLAGQDMVLLGERGQAKSRLVRALVSLLDDAIPAIAGCEIHDSPYQPLCRRCRDLVAEAGEDTPLVWLGREERFSEKLATPDVSIADLIGEVDPIRVAEGRYLSDELTIHYGLVPRTHRGIFAINELPDLAERIQVGLLNVIEERDIQIRGYQLRLPLDIFVVATANPEDYTNRGRIITPLKDRFGAQIRTHYPATAEDEMAIVEQERMRFDEMPVSVHVPGYMAEIVAEVTQVARHHQQVNQKSGVSVRVSIANMEALMGNALRRAVGLGEKEAVARMSDLRAIAASTAGKLEFESWEEGDEHLILEKVVKTACHNVFRRHFAPQEFAELLQRFDRGGFTVEVGEHQRADSYSRIADELPGIEALLSRLGEPPGPGSQAAIVEFVLEGLHLSKRLNKTEIGDSAVYGS